MNMPLDFIIVNYIFKSTKLNYSYFNFLNKLAFIEVIKMDLHSETTGLIYFPN